MITPAPAVRDGHSAENPRPAISSSFTSRQLLWVALGILICRLLVALAIIPPWQQPDEHAHVAIAEVWRNRIVAANTSDPGREYEILRSMGEHRWWQHYDKSTPDRPLPNKFILAPAGATIGIEPTSPGYPPAYYAFIGAALSTIPRMSVVSDLYAMRMFSIALAVLTLLAAWAGVRVALGEHSAGVVTLLLALHAQFAVVSTSASPDPLVNLAGACIWWQAMLALHRSKWLLPLVGAGVAAVVAAAADRMGVPLLLAAFVVSVLELQRRAGVRPVTVALIVGGSVLVAAALWIIDSWWRVFPADRVGYQLTPMPEAQEIDFFLGFTSFLVQSWWFSLGWVRYAPPSWWSAVVFTLTACALVGAMRRWVVERDPAIRTVIGLATIMIVTQVAAVFWTFYRNAHGPQGRHLFPFLVPMLILLWVGVEAATPPRYRRHAATGLVLTFALLDSVAWIVVGNGAYAA